MTRLRNLPTRAQFEPSFHSLGFVMCLSASAARALKSVLQEVLLSDGCAALNALLLARAHVAHACVLHLRREKMHSLNLLSHMAPMALLMLIPLVLLLGAPRCVALRACV
jgi:hypothetical protein